MRNRHDLELRTLDIHGPQEVQVVIDQSAGIPGERTLWVNIDGICRLRVGGILPDTLTTRIKK